MEKLKMKPINNKKAYFRITESIISMIAEGKLEYGEKLYNEHELVNILNVSRPTLREALRVLEFLGVITVTPRKGIVINDPKDNNTFIPLKYLLAFEKIQNQNLLELRTAIELAMVKFAALRGTEQDFAQLKITLDKMSNLEEDDISGFIELDHLFHMDIVKCSKNTLCYKLMYTLSNLIYDQLERIDNQLTIAEKQNALKMHTLIFQAIIERDGDKAQAYLKDHLEHAYGVVENLPDIMKDINF